MKIKTLEEEIRMRTQKVENGDGSPLRSEKNVLKNRKPSSLNHFNLQQNENFVQAWRELYWIKQQLDKSADAALRQVQVAKLEFKKLIVTIIFEIFAGYLMGLMGVIASLRMPKGEPLPDLGFELFGEIPLAHINNHWMSLIIALTIIRVLYHPERVIIFRRILIVHSLICIVRSFCIVATSLPDPSPACRHFTLKHHILVEALYRLVTFGFDVCGDVFFSGHFAMCVLMGMVWEQYTKERLYTNIMWFMVVVEAFFILSTRYHYTIDIIIGGYLGFRMWNTYHSFSPFFGWLESAPAVVRLNQQESNETFELWLSRIPSVRNTAM